MEEVVVEVEVKTHRTSGDRRMEGWMEERWKERRRPDGDECNEDNEGEEMKVNEEGE